ncbi:cell division protein FtsQ/DivIB [Methylocaldum sp.]|uniref:cell division protein FtsQ/DivIB n=1 Tax=Methylocaldum sp. TaxID=1969727 RepID=UPI002D2BDA79|nr:cell division protein FtsQ/DivIB [Methylocaldum sp.]HYE35831.1 cell division protein FtsQ/DivIB [Methylocaldum sp.]
MPKSRKVPARALFLYGLLALCGLAAMSVDFSRLKGFMPIRYVRVEGEIRNLDAAEFRKALLPWAQVGYFLADMHGIEETAKSFPWIASVQVARLWPDTLLLKVIEQKPVARSGDGSLINYRGGRFSPENIQSYVKLPILDGPQGQEKHLLNMLYLLNGKLKQRDMRIDVLKLTNRRAWSAHLSSGVEIEFGKQDPSLAMDRLLALLPRLGEERIAALQKVDLRYPNGFAVIFRPESRAELNSLTQPDCIERGRIRSRAYT